MREREPIVPLVLLPCSLFLPSFLYCPFFLCFALLCFASVFLLLYCSFFISCFASLTDRSEEEWYGNHYLVMHDRFPIGNQYVLRLPSAITDQNIVGNL
jgi:hypothetical protein